MKELYLIRHAHAAGPEPGQSDRDRPLSRRGELDARRVGAYLASLAAPPELMLISPAERTRRTAGHLLSALGESCERRVEASIYEAAPSDLFALLQDLPAALSRVALVGHNPAVSSLLGVLVQQWPLELQPAALAHMRIECDWPELAPGAARLINIEQPHGL